MKYLAITALLLVSMLASAQVQVKSTNTSVKAAADKVTSEVAASDQAEKINWMSWEEAYEANKKTPKKIFVDIYTDWCGWCKKMDKSTFVDPAIVKVMNEDFYAVKFDAEQKGDIIFNEATFSFVQQGRRGSHQLAFALLDGRMSYPSFVLLDENFNRVMLAPGYKTPDKLMPQLKYTSTEAYKTQNFQDFSKAE